MAVSLAVCRCVVNILYIDMRKTMARCDLPVTDDTAVETDAVADSVP